nr:YadA-like family protein [uncultured Haemophilus sp.]
MNKAYKVIWNATMQCWVAVSELSKSKGKTKSKKLLNAAVVVSAAAGALVGSAEAAVDYSTGGTFGGGMAIGSSSYANTNAIAYGHEANARALEDVAIGYKTIAGAAISGSTSHTSEQASVAVGTNAQAQNVATVAIGAHAKANVNFGTAVGAGATAAGENGSAFGQGAQAKGVYSTALGKSAQAVQDYSIALGKEALANTQLTTSIGSKTNATGFSAIAIGSGHVPATGSTVIENIQGAQAVADDSMAIGASAFANKTAATALGKLSNATGDAATAVGSDTNAIGRSSVVVGYKSRADKESSMALGNSSNATGENATAIGRNSKAQNQNSLAIGTNSTATAANTTVIGADANATSNAVNSTVIGRGAVVNASDATVIGPVAQAHGANATAIGRGAAANGTESTALGRGATATANQSLALGKGSSVTVDSGVALGDGAVANRVARDKNTIQINTQNLAATTGLSDNNNGGDANTVYAPVKLVDAPGALEAIKNTVMGNKGAVSVGDANNTRQIINVAPGSADSDAVNVAQLKAVAGAIKKYSVTSPDGSITITDPATGDDPQNFQIQMNTTAVRNAAAWKIKDNGKADSTAAEVKGGDVVDFRGTNSVKVERSGRDLTFSANTASIIGNSDGSVKSRASDAYSTTNTAPADWLVTSINVADAINKSGWQLQANGSRVGLVNPGDKVNFEAGNGVTITPTNEANGVSKLNIAAKVDNSTISYNSKGELQANTNYGWSIKTANTTAVAVPNGQAVSLNEGQYINITHNGRDLQFNAKTADVGMNTATGATNQATATGLATNKAVADAIQASGFQLKENGTLKNVVNPGESLNFKPGQGTTVSVGANGDVQVNANVADIKAGNNVTVTNNSGVYTINANDTNTQVTVTNATSSPITIATTQNTNGTSHYTVDVNVDGTTIKKENGVLKAIIPAVETVTLNVNTTGNNAGKVDAPKDADKGKLVTAENVAKAINESFWIAKKGTRVETNNDNATTAESNIAAGNNVTFIAGKNIALEKKGNAFIYATKDDVSFNNVTANNSVTNNLTVNPNNTAGSTFKVGGNTTVDMGGNQIHNVSNGTAPTDAVNLSQLNASAAAAKTEVKAGKNVSSVNESKDAKDGHTIYTIDTVDNSAHVQAAANNAAVKVEKATATRADGNTTVTDYTVDLTDATKTNITHGVNANETVTNKGLTFNGNTGSTGAKKLGSTVDVKGGDKVITTTATDAGITINYNGTEAAKVTNLTYKANGDNAQNVSLATGLNFKNGNGTTVTVGADGEVTYNANVSGLTAGDNVQITNDGKGNFTIAATDTNTQSSVVNVTSSPVTVAVSDNTNGTKQYAVDVNVDGTTITKEGGVLKAIIPAVEKVDLTVNKTGDNAGKVETPADADKGKLVTAENVAKAVNESFWIAKKGDRVETNADTTSDDSNIAAGNNVTFIAGKNIALQKDGNKFIYATKDDVSFNNVTANNTTTTNLTVNNGGNVDMGNNKVKNVGAGNVTSTSTEAVNGSQLYAVDSKFNNTVSLGGDNSTSTGTQALNKDGGLKFNIVGADNGNITTTALGTDVKIDLTEGTKKDIKQGVDANTTVTNKGLTFNADNGNTGIKKLGSEVDVKGGDKVITTNATTAGITINYNGTEAAKVTNLTYKANGANAQSVNLTTGLDFTNGTQTTAEVAANGVVKFNVNTTALSNVTNNGKITVPDGNGLVTAKEVAEAINASYWKANAGGNVDGTTTADNVTTGTEVFFAAGKNLKVKHTANNFTFSTADDVSFNNVTANNVTAGNTTTTNLTVNNGGNVDMGGNQVHNVANGTKGSDAVNLSQLNATTAIANAGWKIKANGNNETTVKPNATVSLNNTDGNILITKTSDNNDVTFNLNPNTTFGVVGKDGKDGVDGSIGVNGKDGASVVINGKDGSIGLTGPKGADGKDGVSVTLKPEKGTTTVNATDGGKEIDRIKYTDTNGTTREVATLDDGLKFAGDDNAVINRTLGSLLNITGGATDSTTANNIRVTNDGKNGLRVQLANNVTFDANGSVKIGDTTVNNGGLTINGGPSITKDGGVNAGDNVISNVSTGVKDNDAVNVKQLKDSVSTESVVAKTGTDNIAEVSPKAGQTLGDKNAQYEVSVSKAKVKDAAVEAVKVNATTGSPITVTTTADAANNSTTYTVNFNGDNAAKEIPLTYKSNGNASTAKMVKLSDGLDFTNGTLTTAVVGDNGVVKFNVNQGAFNTTIADVNGKLNNASKEGVATVEEVIKAVNAAGWVVTSGNTSTGTVSGTSREVINPGDAVKFIAGQNVDITQDKGNFTIATRENVSFTTVTVGKDGKDGKDGSIGVNGKDGASVVINGKDGSIGLTGPKGADGKDGVSVTLKPEKGTTTVNATDAGKEIDRIKYTDTNGTTREVATLDDGLKFKGDSSQVINRTLGSQMNITGGANETTLTDNNIGVVYDTATDGLKVKLAKDVNLTSNGSVTIGNTTLNNNGFTITNKADPSKTVSVTDKGLNNGGNTIINVAPGVNGTDAVNLDQLNATTAIANAGWVIKANGTNATTVKPNATVSLNNTDGNILITKNKTDNNVTFNFNPNATFGVKGKDGKDGVDGSIGVNGKDGSSVVINGKDGSIGLNGKDGKNGLSIKGDQGPAGVDGKDGETKTRIVYEYADPQDPNKTIRENVATLNDGLIFTGNNGVRNNHKLNTLVTIIGEGVDKAASANFTSASGNINVKADGKGTLEVQLAKNLKNIETINNGNSTITLNKDGGTTISGGDVSVDGNKVTNVKDGDVSANSKDAVNGSQLYHVMTNATAGWNLSVNNGKDKGNVKPGAQVDLNNTDGNIIISKNANNVTFNFNPNATFGVKGKDGKGGVDGSISVNGNDGSSVVLNGKGGSIGLTGPKGADGKDGASANMSVQKGTTTVNTDRDGGKEVTRIVYTDKDKDGKDIKREVATLDDGLKFKGDSEQVINRTLGSQMNITGGADSTKLTDNNIGVVYDEATNGLKVKLSKDVDLGKDGSITIGGTQVTNNGLTIKGGPSVTEKGVDAGNKKVTNVADGDINETSKDAVNGSQLYQAVNNINKNVNAAKTELEEGDNVTITSRVGNNGQTIYKVSSTDNSAHVQGGSDAVSVTKAETTRKDGSTTVTDYTVDLSSKTKDDIKKGVDAHDTVTNKGLTFNADKGTTGAKKLGSQVAVNGDNKNIETVADTNGVKVKLKDDINVNSVTANTFKAGDTIVNTKGVQVAAKDDRGNNTNVVINEKGINAGNTRIQNVAAGRADTDAVNVSQLKGAVTQIGNHINKMDKNLRAGIAGAMAAGGLYHATLPGKSMVAAGAGTYKGESAVAVGYSRLSDNGKVGIKFSVNTNTRGDAGAAASVGYQW